MQDRRASTGDLARNCELIDNARDSKTVAREAVQRPVRGFALCLTRVGSSRAIAAAADGAASVKGA